MPDSVTQWLEQLGLGQYAEAFEENAIEWDELSKLSDDEMKEAGVNALGDRKRIRESAAAIGSERKLRAHYLHNRIGASLAL